MSSLPAYQNLTLLPIAGQWREGTSGRTLDVVDPFTEGTLLSLPMAGREDLDEAYRGARDAQPEWAAMGPTARGDVMRRAVALFDARKEEITGWLVREAGSTRIKAEIEWGSARAITQEAASLPGLVTALGALDYPPEKLDIKLVVEADDSLTRDAIAALALPSHMEEVAVPAVGPRTKPKALNMALPFARGRFVAIFDAEDLPEPDQLRRALATFRAGGPELACVQARLAIDNGAESWISGHFAAEYAGQFDVLLPVLAALGLPILLGGTSNHFRRDVLEAVGGWDPFNVTEDADLGVRLARVGYTTAVIAATTYEEAPVHIGAWIGQRTRWLKGWAQTILVHGRRPRALLRDLGPGATLGLAVLTAGPFAAALVHPICLALLLHDGVRGVLGLPRESMAEVLAAALATTTLIAGYAGTAWASTVGVRRRGLALRWRIIFSIPLYWLLLSLAAWRALVELMRRPHHWQKTEHGVSPRPRRIPASGEPEGAPGA